jgi:hypothetical protein
LFGSKIEGVDNTQVEKLLQQRSVKMSEQSVQANAKPATTTDQFGGWLRRLYRLSVVIIAAFIILSTILFVGRAAVYKIHAYERGLHLRGGKFISVEEPGWHWVMSKISRL